MRRRFYIADEHRAFVKVDDHLEMRIPIDRTTEGLITGKMIFRPFGAFPEELVEAISEQLHEGGLFMCADLDPAQAIACNLAGQYLRGYKWGRAPNVRKIRTRCHSQDDVNEIVKADWARIVALRAKQEKK